MVVHIRCFIGIADLLVYPTTKTVLIQCLEKETECISSLGLPKEQQLPLSVESRVAACRGRPPFMQTTTTHLIRSTMPGRRTANRIVSRNVTHLQSIVVVNVVFPSSRLKESISKFIKHNDLYTLIIWCTCVEVMLCFWVRHSYQHCHIPILIIFRNNRRQRITAFICLENFNMNRSRSTYSQRRP